MFMRIIYFIFKTAHLYSKTIKQKVFKKSVEENHNISEPEHQKAKHLYTRILPSFSSQLLQKTASHHTQT